MSDIRLDLACRQIVFAREYTLSLLRDLPDEQWLAVATGAPTHIAWQVGHLAMAEYGLCLFRLRGRRPADLDLMSSTFRKRFSRGSTPHLEPDGHLSPADIRETLARVHEQVLAELPGYSEELLNEPIDEPYAAFNTKLGALLFCSHHELLHAGQIGLIRRLLGKPPVR